MRLQILELPTWHDDGHMTTPFILVMSEVSPRFQPRECPKEFRDEIGAAGILITDEVVEIGPAPEPVSKALTSAINVYAPSSD